MKNNYYISLSVALASTLIGNLFAQQLDRTVLPIQAPIPKTYTELDVRNATAPARFEVKAPTGAPNVVLILLDDMGFGCSEAFGGPVPMPTIDKIGKNGLKYNRFHTTSVCSPTRAALQTGYNHHSNNAGSIMETGTAFPGNNCIRPQQITTMAEVLKQNGYNTAMFGKCHETPPWEISISGPFNRWPTGAGYEKFYGFVGGETNQWSPLVYDGTAVVELPEDPNYHFMNDMTNKAISWIGYQQAITPDKPFFVYFAPGATHAPHHAPKEWIDKYKGKFDMGWDKMREETLARQIKMGVVPAGTKLAPKPTDIKDWKNLSDKERKLFSRQMEVYAGFAAYTDYEISRLVGFLEERKIADNTVIIYIAGDNGASAEGQMNGMFNEMTYFNGLPETVDDMSKKLDEWGSPSTYPHMAAGWAVALDAPFSYTKQVGSDYGGTRNGMVIQWAKGIKARGEVRSQFTHVIDVAPTIYEITNIPAPKVVNGVEQAPIEGTSFAYSFADGKAKERHTQQYFEMFGNRAIYKDGWLARTIHRVAWKAKPDVTLENDVWDLYNDSQDFSLANNLAQKNPEKLKEMQALFMKDAEKFHVLPIDDRVMERINAANVGRPTVSDGRTSMILGEGMNAMGVDVFLSLRNTSFKITADIEANANTNGVIVCQGGRFGGLSFYVKDGKPAFTYNYLGLQSSDIISTEKLTPGKHTVTFEFKFEGKPTAGGAGIISVDGKKSFEGRIEKTQPGIFSVDDLADVGTDDGTHVANYGKSPKFNGKINKVVVEQVK